jgi:hypothetical protein
MLKSVQKAVEVDVVADAGVVKAAEKVVEKAAAVVDEEVGVKAAEDGVKAAEDVEAEAHGDRAVVKDEVLAELEAEDAEVAASILLTSRLSRLCKQGTICVERSNVTWNSSEWRIRWWDLDVLLI